jgi:hypothetical protein
MTSVVVAVDHSHLQFTLQAVARMCGAVRCLFRNFVSSLDFLVPGT